MNVNGLERNTRFGSTFLCTVLLFCQERLPVLITEKVGTTSAGGIVDQEEEPRNLLDAVECRGGLLTSVIIVSLAMRYTVFLTFSSMRARNPGSSNSGDPALELAARYSRSLTISSLRTRPIAKTCTGYRMEGESKRGGEGGQPYILSLHSSSRTERVRRKWGRDGWLTEWSCCTGL